MTPDPKELTLAEVAEELTKFCDLTQVASGRPVMVPIVDETFELLRRAAELLRWMGELVGSEHTRIVRTIEKLKDAGKAVP